MRSLLVAALVILGSAALAQDQHQDQHPPEHAELHELFYQSWMRPDQPNVSCCSRKDCAPVRQVRRVGGRWEAQRERDGAWLVIPPEKIEQNRDSPDGRSHLCSADGKVFCFVHGGGT